MESNPTHQQHNITPTIIDQQYGTAPKINDKQPKLTSVQNPPLVLTCDGCGRMYFPHQLHTCPSCGKQLCDKCYPEHECKKQRLLPPPNTHIALDQQEWYNKQPTPCDKCGKIVRADALRKLDGKKVCPDCVLKFAITAKQREKRTIILAICTVGIIVIWLFFCLRG